MNEAGAEADLLCWSRSSMTIHRQPQTITKLAIVAAIVVAAGCRTNPERASRDYVARGDRYLAQNKLSEAIIEYRTAIKTFPRSGEAHFKLAEALVVHDDMRTAFAEYLRAADLLPDREDVQLKAGNLQLVAGRFVDAKARARAILQRNPRSAGAMILLGNALAGMHDLDTAVAVSQR